MDRDLRETLTRKYHYLTWFENHQKEILKKYHTILKPVSRSGTYIFLLRDKDARNIISWFLFGVTTCMIPQTDLVEICRHTFPRSTRHSTPKTITDTTVLEWEVFFEHFKTNLFLLKHEEGDFPVYGIHRDKELEKKLNTLHFTQEKAHDRGIPCSMKRFKELLLTGF